MSTYAYMPESDEKLNAAFLKLGIPAGNIYIDTRKTETSKPQTGKTETGKSQSGKSDTGPAYRKLLRQLQKGDTLYVQSLDVFGFGMQEILSQWRDLTKDRGVDIAVMNSPLLDTRRGKELNGSLVADVVAEVLSYAVNDTRERHYRRQKAGIERARERGVHCGRVAKPLPDNFEAVCKQWKNGEISATEAARRCDMPVSTFRYRANQAEALAEQ